MKESEREYVRLNSFVFYNESDWFIIVLIMLLLFNTIPSFHYKKFKFMFLVLFIHISTKFQFLHI